MQKAQCEIWSQMARSGMSLDVQPQMRNTYNNSKEDTRPK